MASSSSGLFFLVFATHVFVFLLFARLGMACLSSRRSPFSSSLSSCLSTCSCSSFSSRCLACRLLPLPLLFRVRLLGPFAGFDALLFEPWPSSSVSAWAGCDALKNAYYNLSSLLPFHSPFLPLPSFLLLSPCLLLLFSLLFSPFSSPRAGCGALNTHLAPLCLLFSLSSSSLSLSFPFFPFSFPRAGCGALNTHLAPFLFCFSLSRSLFLSFLLFLLPLFLLLPVVPLRPLRDGMFVVSFFKFAVLFFYQV